MFGSPGNTGQPEGDQYVGELQIAIEGAHRVARETLKQSQKRMKRDYDVKVRVKETLVPQAVQSPYPVLLFTEDLSAPANCGKYLSQLR
jgi:hypothetical protein